VRIHGTNQRHPASRENQCADESDYLQYKAPNPRPQKRQDMSPAVQKLNNEICRRVGAGHCPNEALIIEKTVSMASQMYRESEAKLNIAASIARKRAEMMIPQDELQITYFTDLISYITLDDGGRLTLHTKTDTEIGDEENASDQNPEKNGNSH
jgi:hypothetical protein